MEFRSEQSFLSGDSESERYEGDMDVDAAYQDDEVAHALAAADLLGKSSNNPELYDEEDNGIADDDSEELEDLTIKVDDVVTVYACNEDDVSHLEACNTQLHMHGFTPSRLLKMPVCHSLVISISTNSSGYWRMQLMVIQACTSTII
ncbi:unnamed protein product [Ilex paraguariensis]|uniref:Uncharacterized protein n=1 Tax=Ilex paraguariensis TaxID=185542 RepID=A0ABC8S1G3_9AQUA